MRLPDPERSYAVLIGVSAYRSTELPGLPSVANNLDGLAEILTDPALGGLPPGRCITLRDPVGVPAVYRSLRRYAMAAQDTLLVYFAGHGRIGMARNELYLSLADTDPGELPVTAMRFDLIREVFADSPAVNRVLILDCCFSGRAIPDMSGPEETIAGQVGIEGTYTLTATPGNEVALAPAGATYTAFTGELLTLLRTGIPGGPQFLTYANIYPRLLHTITSRGFPRPRQCGTGTVDQLALARNPGHVAQVPPQAGVVPAPQRLDVRGKKLDSLLASLFGILSGIALLVGDIGLALTGNWKDHATGLAVTCGICTVLGAFLVIGGLACSAVALNPFEFRADQKGVELTRAGRRVSYRWPEVESMTVRKRSGGVLCVRLASGAVTPQPRALGYPRFQQATGRLLLCPIRDLRIDAAALCGTLAGFAGSRWEAPEWMDGIADPGRAGGCEVVMALEVRDSDFGHKHYVDLEYRSLCLQCGQESERPAPVCTGCGAPTTRKHRETVQVSFPSRPCYGKKVRIGSYERTSEAARDSCDLYAIFFRRRSFLAGFWVDMRTAWLAFAGGDAASSTGTPAGQWIGGDRGRLKYRFRHGEAGGKT